MIRFPKMHSKKLQKKNNVAYLMAGGEKKLLLSEVKMKTFIRAENCCCFSQESEKSET